MTAGMVEGNPSVALGIDGLHCCEFSAVAALAGPRWIVEFVTSAPAARNDMFCGKVVRRVVCGTAAVFTPASRPFLDSLPNL